ncbi:unnamed protein product [Durusdinium trenchii]|uniref:Uncharacterized protein n=1 Tax=Durusdinium trenchii TaxID=1381693 RepID=A0ABP0SSV3_9DINO
MVGVYPWVYHGSVQLGNTWALLKSAKGFTSKSTRRSKFGTGEPSKSGLASVLAGGALEAASPEGAVLELGFWFSEACRSKADVTSFASDSKSSIFFKPAGWLLEYLFLMRQAADHSPNLHQRATSLTSWPNDLSSRHSCLLQLLAAQMR